MATTNSFSGEGGSGAGAVCDSDEEWSLVRQSERRAGRKRNAIVSSGSETDTSLVSMRSEVSTQSEQRKRRSAFMKKAGSGSDNSIPKKRKGAKPDSPPPTATRGASATTKKGPDKLPAPEEIRGDIVNLPTADIGAEIARHVAEVERVARTSGNLKGTYVRQLKIAACTVRVAAVELALRTQSDCDARQLQAQNARLQNEVTTLREEVDRLRAAVLRGTQPPSTPPAGGTASTSAATGAGDKGSPPSTAPSPPLTGDDLIAAVGRMMDAKIEALRADLTLGPVRRPPLAHERRDTRRATESGGEKKKGVKGTRKRNNKIPDPTPASESAAPPTATGTQGSQVKDTWALVVGRKSKAVSRKTTGQPVAKPPQQPAPKRSLPKSAKHGQSVTKGPQSGATGTARAPRPPRTAAVTLTIGEGSQATYASVMAYAKEKVSLNALGIAEVRPKRAVTGGLILEIPGQDGASKADALATKMGEVLAHMGVKVSRPVKRAELRVTGLEDSVTPEEVAGAIAAATGCAAGEIQTGLIRRSPSRMGSLWLRCPLSAARKLVAAGRVTVGWVSARVNLLTQRPLQCYKCLEVGHVRTKCPNNADRSGRCYTCGTEGHRARECKAAAPHCPLCEDAGRPAEHRLGGRACAPASKRGKRKGNSGEQATAAKTTTLTGSVPSRDDENASKDAQGKNGQEEAMEITS